MVIIVIEFILFFIPRFVTDRVALGCDHGEWYVISLERNLDDYERQFVHAYGTIRTFTWFGFAKGGLVKLD